MQKLDEKYDKNLYVIRQQLSELARQPRADFWEFHIEGFMIG